MAKDAGLSMPHPPGTAWLGPEEGRSRLRCDRLCHIAYVSRAADQDAAWLRWQTELIASVSSRRNGLLGLTGALAFGGGWFAQVLEGRQSHLLPLFDDILADPRHTDVRLLDFAPIARRRFSAWSMACSGPVAAEVVRCGALAYARQERLARGCAANHGRIIASAMVEKLRAWSSAHTC